MSARRPPRLAHRLGVFARKVGRGINRFGLIEDGDRILIGVSGGKDSLALCAALSERRRWVPIRYELAALLIDWREYPVAAGQLQAVQGYLEDLGIPLRIVQAHMFPEGYQKPFSCYICSRNRKRILFGEAERLGMRKIALGHHMDDIIETTLMNLFFRGEVATMMPMQEFFDGGMKIIRPMCEVQEKDVLRLARHFALPAYTVACPRREVNRRVLMKEIVRRVSRVNRRARENLYRAMWNLNRAYLPDPVEAAGPAEEGAQPAEPAPRAGRPCTGPDSAIE